MGELRIERVTGEGAARRWHTVDVATREADHVGLPADPLSERLALLAGSTAAERVELWLGLTADGAVAASELWFPLRDNTTAVTIDVRVHPGHRRSGHGRRMLGHALDRARAQPRHLVFGEVAEPLVGAPVAAGGAPVGPPVDAVLDAAPDPAASVVAGAALARSVGARPVLTEIRRMLDLASLPPARLASLRTEACRQAQGYTLVQWVDRAPVELHEDLARLMARMSTDPPLEEMAWEPEDWTAQRYAATEDDMIVGGRRRLATVARHAGTGQLVAYTDVEVGAGRSPVAGQQDTIVAPAHRGHRLGLLVKAANLQLLRENFAEVRLVNTWNAAANAHMISINDALGFRPVERWRQWQLELRN